MRKDVKIDPIRHKTGLELDVEKSGEDNGSEPMLSKTSGRIIVSYSDIGKIIDIPQ